MIGVINPSATQTLAKQLTFAENAIYQLMPGEPFPSEKAVPIPTPGGGPPESISGGRSDDGGGVGLSPSAIAGTAIGAAAVLIFGAMLVYLYGQGGGFDKVYRKRGSPSIGEVSNANIGPIPNTLELARMSTFTGHDASSSIYSGAGGYAHITATQSPGTRGPGMLPSQGFSAAARHWHQGYGDGTPP
jgi:hypothetical protein